MCRKKRKEDAMEKREGIAHVPKAAVDGFARTLE